MTVRRHLLVTNDFPPKVGGIQSYLWELWSRLDPLSFRVLTASSDPSAEAFDHEQRKRGLIIDRVPNSTLFFPTPSAHKAVMRAIKRFDPDLVILDPTFPLGRLANKIPVLTAVIVHGAEVTIPRRLPGVHGVLKRIVASSDGVLAAGPYPRRQIEELGLRQCPPILEIPPGVDTKRFVPLQEDEIARERDRLGIDRDAVLVSSVSRLVPRKGMDTLIKASRIVNDEITNLHVVIGGTGREQERLAGLAKSLDAPVTMLGRVDDDDLPKLLGASDLFVMACRSRWGGLEEEGFGIVFLEAAASGIAQIAGSSGGSADAVVDGETGVVLGQPEDPVGLGSSMLKILGDNDFRASLGREARLRAVASYDYDVLAHRLGDALNSGWPASMASPK